jgi:hypothetical protein
MSKPQSLNRPHPLEDIVLKAFAERDIMDRIILANYLAGAYVHPGFSAYKMVAADVLGYMECQGKVCRDEKSPNKKNLEGVWFYLTK